MSKSDNHEEYPLSSKKAKISHNRYIMRRLVVGTVAATAVIGSVVALNQEATTEPRTSCTITVQPGDRLDDIANGKSSLVDDLYEANNNSASIYPGDVISLGQTACKRLAEIGVSIKPITPQD